MDNIKAKIEQLLGEARVLWENREKLSAEINRINTRLNEIQGGVNALSDLLPREEPPAPQ